MYCLLSCCSIKTKPQTFLYPFAAIQTLRGQCADTVALTRHLLGKNKKLGFLFYRLFLRSPQSPQFIIHLYRWLARNMVKPTKSAACKVWWKNEKEAHCFLVCITPNGQQSMRRWGKIRRSSGCELQESYHSLWTVEMPTRQTEWGRKAEHLGTNSESH